MHNIYIINATKTVETILFTLTDLIFFYLSISEISKTKTNGKIFYKYMNIFFIMIGTFYYHRQTLLVNNFARFIPQQGTNGHQEFEANKSISYIP